MVRKLRGEEENLKQTVGPNRGGEDLARKAGFSEQ